MHSVAGFVGIVFLLSELIIGFKRSGADAAKKDRGSLRILGAVIWLGVIAGYNAGKWFPSLRMADRDTVSWIGLCVFLVGLLIRWISVIQLGRFFTVDVAISSGQRIIESGPYRYLRHPSYTGALLCFVGLCLTLGNWASLVAIMVPTCCAFLWRMHIEEQALTEAFGEGYKSYMKRTKRVIPFVY